MDLWKVPPILVFHLKRFSYEVGQWSTQRDKLDDYVDFPDTIDVRPYVLSKSTEEDGEPMMYELIAVCNHMGNLGFGHYTAYTKRGNQWYCCNDSTVSKVPASSIKSASAYVLFYRKVENNTTGASAASAEPTKDDTDSGATAPRGEVPPLPFVDENGNEQPLNSDEDEDPSAANVPV